MQRRLLVIADREIAIAPHLAAEDEHVAGAVHRLQPHLLAFGLDEEHVLPVMRPVPGGLPQRLVEDDRRFHLGVARRDEHSAHVIREQVVEQRALLEPERRARRPLVEHEELLLATDLPVVALLRFFDAREVILEVFLREERGSVHALHWLIARVAFPIRVRRREQLERLQLSGGRHVRANTEVDERLLVLDRVAGDLALTLGLLLDQLDLERFAATGEETLGLLARPHLPLEDQILIRELAHLVLDRLEILGHERARHDEVVEEPFVGWRTDAALHAGEHVRDGRGEQVRCAVAVKGKSLRRVLRRNDLNRRVSGQWIREIDKPIPDFASQGRLAQTGRDRRRQIADSRTGRHTTTGTIWQRHTDLRHQK